MRYIGYLDIKEIYKDIKFIKMTPDGMGGFKKEKVENLKEANCIKIDCDLSFSNPSDLVKVLSKTEIAFYNDGEKILSKPLGDRNNTYWFAEQFKYSLIKIVNIEPRKSKLIEIHNEWMNLEGDQEVPNKIYLSYWYKEKLHYKLLYEHNKE